MDRESRETWAKRVERWKDSGLTAKEFAAELGINAHSLAWWKWRLGARKPAARSAPPRRARKPPAVGPLTFVEVPSAEPSDSIEVVLPSSVRIRVPATFDAMALGRLLDVLEQRR